MCGLWTGRGGIQRAITSSHRHNHSGKILQGNQFEPLQSVELSALSMKTALLTALSSVEGGGSTSPLR